MGETAAGRFCGECGQPRPEEGRFCPGCGSDAAPPASSVEPPEPAHAEEDAAPHPHAFAETVAFATPPMTPPAPVAPIAAVTPVVPAPGVAAPVVAAPVGAMAAPVAAVAAPVAPARRTSTFPLVLAAILVPLVAAAFFGGWWWQTHQRSASAPQAAPTPSSATVQPAADVMPKPAGPAPAGIQPSVEPSPTALPDVVAGAEAVECERVGTGQYAAVARATKETSCEFARAVRVEYLRAGLSGTPGEVTADSPVTGRSYVMHCEGRQPVRCTGGTNAVVLLYGGRLVLS